MSSTICPCAYLNSKEPISQVVTDIKLHPIMIDKSWINKPIKSKDYLNGAVQFLDFAFSNPECDGTILCPCSVCRFGYSGNRIEVFSHILQKGFLRKYTVWYMHGEKNVHSSVGSSSQVKEVPIGQYPMQDMLNDVFGGLGGQGFQESSSSSLPNSDHSTTIKDASINFVSSSSCFRGGLFQMCSTFLNEDNHLLQLMTTQVVVDEVWYLELQNLKLGETPLSLRKGK
ncbi:hypothetical protein P8452_55046 [Trifolium repens]|nr:hypothetical protein P8452_16618 [Trifolium repens]WJX71001.1 hypothetical protein P8452_55046 [Trifolium repens]